jgi:hypothetical protein
VRVFGARFWRALLVRVSVAHFWCAFLMLLGETPLGFRHLDALVGFGGFRRVSAGFGGVPWRSLAFGGV